jgi:hypothetical protein
VLYAIVAADSDFAIDVFVDRATAAQALAEVLGDEPAFVELLSVVELPQEESRAAPWIRAQAATS